MEFVAVASVRLPPMEIQRRISITNLTEWCASIDKVLSSNGEKGEIYCVWGDFRVHREVIRDGVRFTLPGCPNALQWTLTSDMGGDRVKVHCTINQQTDDPDFIESLEGFVEDWKAGLEGWPERNASRSKKPVGECAQTYGGFG